MLTFPGKLILRYDVHGVPHMMKYTAFPEKLYPYAHTHTPYCVHLWYSHRRDDLGKTRDPAELQAFSPSTVVARGSLYNRDYGGHSVGRRVALLYNTLRDQRVTS